MDQQFKDKDETIYTLKENMGIFLCNLGVGKTFLILNPLLEAMGKKIDAFDYINIKSLCMANK